MTITEQRKELAKEKKALRDKFNTEMDCINAKIAALSVPYWKEKKEAQIRRILRIGKIHFIDGKTKAETAREIGKSQCAVTYALHDFVRLARNKIGHDEWTVTEISEWLKAQQ